MANVNEFMLGEFVKIENVYGQIVAIDKQYIGVYHFNNLVGHNCNWTGVCVNFLDNKVPTGNHCWWYNPESIKHCVTEDDAKKEFHGFHLGDRVSHSVHGTGIVVAFDKRGWLGIALDSGTGYPHRFDGIFEEEHDDMFVTASNFVPRDGDYAAWLIPESCELVSRPNYGHKQKPVSYVINKKFPKIVITTDGHETKCIRYNPDGTKDQTVATCHPDDKFNFDTGAMLAFSRMYNLPDNSVKPDVVDGDYICVKNIGGGFTVGKIYHFDNGYAFDDDGDKRPMCGIPLVKSQLEDYGFIPLVK